MTAAVPCPTCNGRGKRRVMDRRDRLYVDVECYVCRGSGAASWRPGAAAATTAGPTPATIPETPERTRRRNDGPATSAAGARDVSIRATSQKADLLRAYGAAGDGGLTDEQAGEQSGLAARRGCCYWKRCGELREDGLIVLTPTTREASTGSEQRVPGGEGEGGEEDEGGEPTHRGHPRGR